MTDTQGWQLMYASPCKDVCHIARGLGRPAPVMCHCSRAAQILELPRRSPLLSFPWWTTPLLLSQKPPVHNTVHWRDGISQGIASKCDVLGQCGHSGKLVSGNVANEYDLLAWPNGKSAICKGSVAPQAGFQARPKLRACCPTQPPMVRSSFCVRHKLQDAKGSGQQTPHEIHNAAAPFCKRSSTARHPSSNLDGP